MSRQLRKLHNPLQLSILLSFSTPTVLPLGVTYISYAVVILGEGLVLCLHTSVVQTKPS